MREDQFIVRRWEISLWLTKIHFGGVYLCMPHVDPWLLTKEINLLPSEDLVRDNLHIPTASGQVNERISAFFNLGSKICMTLEYWDMQHTWGKERLKLFCLKLCGKPRLQVYKEDLESLWASQTMLNHCVTERSGYRCSFVCVLEWSSAHFWSWLNDSYSCPIFSNAQADAGTVWPGTGIIKCEETADEETFKTEPHVPGRFYCKEKEKLMSICTTFSVTAGMKKEP